MKENETKQQKSLPCLLSTAFKLNLYFFKLIKVILYFIQMGGSTFAKIR